MSVRVLIADDFELARVGIESALGADPEIEVVGHAADGHEAVERARELRPDVVLLDLRMSGHGGMEALHVLREQLPGARVLVLTANESPDIARASIRAGAAGYLSKRTPADELREAVRAVHRDGSIGAPLLAAGPSREDDLPRLDDRSSDHLTLTARQRAIVRLVSVGLTDREIAESLFVSRRTVQYDLREVKRKAGLARRSEIARWAVINSLG